MKLDVNALRYLSKDEFRTLQAVELGQKNHELVPIPLVDSIAGLRQGGTVRCLKALLRAKLVHHDNSKYDGYRLTNLGYDFLALNALVKRGAIAAVGRQIGVGKESDVFEVLSPEGERLALKLHRLGRTSFRAVASKRDYLKHRTSFSWLYLSRLAALKEHAFMAALGEQGLPVPRAIAHNRHAVLMSLVDGVPLVQVKELGNMVAIFRQCLDLMVSLARLGLVHCDFNEFNLLVSDEEEVTLIDFPQMISTSHANAADWFERDVACLVRFFTRKLGYIPDLDPDHREPPTFQEAMTASQGGLDITLAASGFKPSHQSVLESFAAQRADGETADDRSSDEASPASSSAESDSEHESLAEGRTTADADCSASDAEAHMPAFHAVDLSGAQDARSSSQTPANLHTAHSDAEHSDSLSQQCEVAENDHEGNADELAAHAAEQERLSQVRRQIAAERKSKQKQGIQARAAKGARQAAARQGRKAIAQTM